MVAKGIERGRRQCIHRVWANQRLDIFYIRVRGVLGARGRPEWTLHLRTLRGERGPARSGELFQEERIGEHRIGDRRLPTQRECVWGANLLQALVDLGIHAAHKETRDTRNAIHRTAGTDAVLETTQVRLDHARVRLDRKQQRDIHVDPVGNQPPKGDRPFRGPGDLDHHIRTIDRLPQTVRLLDRGSRIVGRSRAHFNRDVAVDGLGALIHRQKQIAGAAHIISFHEFEHRPGIRDRGGRLNLRVVRGALRERLFENRWVRRLASQRFIADTPLEFAIVEHRPVDVVEPNGLAGGVQRVERRGHGRAIPNEV